MTRPSLTFLVIYPHNVVRADFDRSGRLLNVWQQPRPDLEDIGLLTEVAAMQGPRLRGNVWILWSDLFNHSLRLDAKSMGLQGKDLESALAFEAEPLSGISAFESVLASQQIAAEKGERDFFVLQSRRNDLELLRDTVAKLGGRLAGLTSTTGWDIPLPGDIDPAIAADDIFRQWLTACAERVLDKKRQPTAIVPEAKPLTSTQRWLIALALAIPVMLLCTAQYLYVSVPQLAERKGEIKKYQDAIEMAKGLDKQAADVTKEKEELKKRNDELKNAILVLQTQRRRVAELLALLGHYCEKEVLIIRKIDNHSGDPVVHGLCLQHPGVATEFARKVGDVALQLGWQVQSPRSHAQHLLPDGGPWSFELQFKDVLAPADLISASKTQPKSGKR